MIAASIYIMYEVMDIIIFWYIISHIVYAAYLRELGSNKWWLALIPFGVTFAINADLVTLPKWLIVCHVLTVLLTFYIPFPFFIAYRAVLYKRDYDISICLYDDASQAKWAFIPGYRYVCMLKYIIGGDKKCA